DVSLRNLVIVPLPGGGGTIGVNMTAGNSLTVEGSLLSGLPSGIQVNTTAIVRLVETTVRTSGVGVFVADGARATVTRCVLSGSYALYAYGVAPGTTTAVSVAGSTIEGSIVGAYVYSVNPTATVRLAMSDSQLNWNNYGLYAYSEAGGTATLTAVNNVVTNAVSTAVYVIGTGAKVWAAGNTVTDSFVGFWATGNGVFESAGNNAVRNNGTDQNGTVTVIPMK
ncbi:MAG: right-handed parallel beta-helix repeat-containing protein, partial [Burkholderiales bacterium]|nr:right-handed parallel beta-helix repeat-containing protein [Burkholderiales bacterium]